MEAITYTQVVEKHQLVKAKAVALYRKLEEGQRHALSALLTQLTVHMEPMQVLAHLNNTGLQTLNEERSELVDFLGRLETIHEKVDQIEHETGVFISREDVEGVMKHFKRARRKVYDTGAYGHKASDPVVNAIRHLKILRDDLQRLTDVRGLMVREYVHENMPGLMATLCSVAYTSYDKPDWENLDRIARAGFLTFANHGTVSIQINGSTHTLTIQPGLTKAIRGHRHETSKRGRTTGAA